MALSILKNKSIEEKAPDSADSSAAEDYSSAEDEEVSDDGHGVQQGNAGWADSIAKVLNTSKPKTKKTLVLSRAKKIKPSEKKNDDDYGFEVEGEIKEEKPSENELELKQQKNQKLELRVKPTWKDLERERALRKVATKGVVQLFNAVRIQQKDLQHQLDEAGPLDSRKEAVLNNINKRKFLDVLMGGKRAKSELVDNPVKNEFKKEEDNESSDEDYDNKKKKSEWNVLRDDFMTNKKNKHWDEEDDDDNSDKPVGSDDDEE